MYNKSTMDKFQKYLLLIERKLQENWEKFSNFLPLYLFSAYHMGWVDEKGNPLTEYKGGKRLRPLLCVLINQAFNGPLDDALNLASSLEFLHNFSLVHDDIQDGDEKRHNRWAVWKLWGIPQAINVGDSLFNLCFQVLTQISSPILQRTSLREITNTIQELIEGQYLDLSFERRSDVYLKEYMIMIEKKTARLFATAFFLGSFSANYKEDLSRKFFEIGKDFGLFFQIADDVLGIWGDPKKTGKPPLGDLWKKKKTFPIIYLLQEASEREKQKLFEIWSREKLLEQDILYILQMLDRKRVKEASINTAERFFEKSYKALEEYDELIDLSLIKELLKNYYNLIFSLQS
ncbi:MAG: polyprenyl synthetase family protein [Dictyoglomaceae bacterium]